MILQGDILEIYNSLTQFSKTTVQTDDPSPISVWFDEEGIGSPLVFEQKGIMVRLRLPIYYCLGLEDLKKKTYLLPEDYDSLMSSLQKIIYDDRILDERTCLSPENYGFDVYAVNKNEFTKGPEIVGKVRFISGNSWFFKVITKWKYKL